MTRCGKIKEIGEKIRDEVKERVSVEGERNSEVKEC